MTSECQSRVKKINQSFDYLFATRIFFVRVRTTNSRGSSMKLMSSSQVVSPQQREQSAQAVSKILDSSDPLLKALLTQMDEASVNLKSLDAIKAKFKK